MSNYNALLYLKELPTVFLENGQKELLLFELVGETLIALDHNYDPSFTLLQFIFKFLTIAGLQINFGVAGNETIYFSPEEGGFNNNKGLPIRSDIYIEMRRISESDSYGTVNDRLSGEILNLLNLYISYHAESKHFADFIENLQKINAG
jgi:recombinational DNA repair protein (RecF pathway)